MSTVLDTLRENRARVQLQADSLLSRTEGRDMTASEGREAKRLTGELTQIDASIMTEEQRAERRAADGRAALQRGDAGRAYTSGQDTVYARGNGHSYFRDLIHASMPGSFEQYDAQQRLLDHAQMVDRAAGDLPSEFRAGPHKRAGNMTGGIEQRVNPNRTDGQGGYFVPPIYLVNEYVPYLRAGRTTANLYQQHDLPTGTDSINIPKLATGTLVATQQDNGAVTSQDFTDAILSGPVRTLAGQSDVAVQLLEQSPVAMDDIILKDLLSTYNQQLDQQLLYGTGSSGQIQGLQSLAGVNAITYTSASPTVPELYPHLTQAPTQIARQVFQAPNGIVMTPQRWWWIVAALDTQNRPLVVPSAGGGNAFNALAVDDATAAEGRVGSLGGVPIYVDANIPINVGAGTNQDTIYAAKWDELYLFEGAPRTRVLVEVLSGTLQVRVQLYNYAAAIPNRFPAAISAINGTGLVSPSGY